MRARWVRPSPAPVVRNVAGTSPGDVKRWVIPAGFLGDPDEVATTLVAHERCEVTTNVRTTSGNQPATRRNSARSARRRREGRDTTLRRGGRHRRRAPRSLGRVPEGPVLGDHGPVRLGEVDVHAHPRRTRPAHHGIGQDRRHRDHRPARQGAHPAAARQGRVRLPVLQPPAGADGGGEHRAAAVDRRDASPIRSGSVSCSRPSA